MRRRSLAEAPRWLLAIGPVLVLVATAGILYLTSPFSDLDAMAAASTSELLWMLAVIGSIAGIVPVLIGMLWFPFIRALDRRYLHAFLALSAGVLAFIAVEMGTEIVRAANAVDRPPVAAIVAVGGVGATFAIMHAVSRWRQYTAAATTSTKSGLEVAYLVAVALGLHSIGEGLAIGTAVVGGEGTLVMLLVVGFVTHNVMEGPTVVAAVARDAAAPPLRHFAAMGLVAGGPVILGGWIGSLADAGLLSILFYAIALGAIGQVLIELGELVRSDAAAIVTRLNAATFAAGIALMFVLEDVVFEGWILPG